MPYSVKSKRDKTETEEATVKEVKDVYRNIYTKKNHLDTNLEENLNLNDIPKLSCDQTISLEGKFQRKKHI